MRSQPGEFDLTRILNDLESVVDSAVYDFVLLYTLHEVPGWIHSRGRFSYVVKNTGLPIELYGYISPFPAWPRLRGSPHMNSVENISVSMPNIPNYGGAITAFHEIFHYWGVDITNNVYGVGPPNWTPEYPVGLLAGSSGHWTWVWDEPGMSGIMYSGATSDRFNEFDLYLMGLMGYEEASQGTHFVYEDGSNPRILHPVTWDDLIYVLSLYEEENTNYTHYEGNGHRIPDTDPAVRNLNVLIVIIKGADETLDSEAIDLVVGMANDIPTAWNIATHGRSAMNIPAIQQNNSYLLWTK